MQASSGGAAPEAPGGALDGGLNGGPDHDLAGRAIGGDEAALRQLWAEHRRWVAAVLLAHMPKTAELDDLLQEVAVAVVAKVSGLREAAAFKPWLRAVAISIAKTTARRSNVRKAGFLRVASFAGRDEREDGSAAVAGPGQREVLREGRRLLELSGDLPDGYREPLLLKCVQGMSYRQIGRVMGLPETTIETRIARARRMLRERAVSAGLTGDADCKQEEIGQGLSGKDYQARAKADRESSREVHHEP